MMSSPEEIMREVRWADEQLFQFDALRFKTLAVKWRTRCILVTIVAAVQAVWLLALAVTA